MTRKVRVQYPGALYPAKSHGVETVEIQPTRFSIIAGLLALLCACALNLNAATLWSIGTPDNNGAEFAFAPTEYKRATEDSFFVIGESDPRQDWPYAQAGPEDNWAGSRTHAGWILFGLQPAPHEGTCKLRLDLLDTHKGNAPRVRVEVNGTPFERALPPGAGDASIYGDAAKGREIIWEISFPAKLLREGANEISISTIKGSWILYDAISLEVPEGSMLAVMPPQTRLGSVEVAPVWLKTNGAAVQPVSIDLRHYGPEVPATLHLEHTELKKIELRRGLQRIEALIPARDQASRQALTLRTTDGKEIASSEVTVSPPRIREMWLLPHSHVDIGYTHRQEEIVQVQISNLETGMRLARESASNPPGMRFKWNPEAVWSLDHFLQKAGAAKRQEFLDAVRRGDVGVDGLYANLLTGLCRPEELAQGLAYGARLSNLTGVPVESASICDVPGWTWGIVPTMAAAGVKYFAIGPNFRDRVGTIHVWDNKPFYWKSQSGRERILCWVVDNYHFCDDLEPHVLSQVRKLESIGFPYDVSFMFWVGRGPGGTVDNAPPDVDTVKKVIAWNEKYAAPKITIGLAGEYFRQFEKKHGSKVPEFSGDLTPYWEDGAGSTSRETAMNRASADRLCQAETIYAMRSPARSPVEQFEAAWKNVLLYTEHTWGAWCSISKPDDSFTLDQWRVKQAFALDADCQSRELLKKALAKAGTEDNSEFEVFNTTQWKRTDVVVVPSELEGNSVLDPKGKPLLSQRLSTGERIFLASDVPAFGSRRFRVSQDGPRTKGSARARQNELANNLLTLKIDPQTGAIASLRRQGFNQEFVDKQAPVGLNDFRYLPGTNSNEAQPRGPSRVTVVEEGPLIAVLRVESSAPGCNNLVSEVRVTHGSDRVEIANHVDRKTVREKDGVHFGFGFSVPSGQLHMETPWAVIRPELDQLPGSCKNWFTVQRWVEIANTHHGITWATLDAPLLQIGGITANLLGSVNFDEWMTNCIESQTIYSWAQNNHWHTNYKIDQAGVTTFRFVLRPHKGGYTSMDSARLGIEITRPLLAAPVRSSLNESLVRVSGDVLVETLKPSTDGKALIVRLFGVTGKHQTVRLNWGNIEPASLWLTDLTEKPLARTGNKIPVPGYGVVHLRAQLQ